MEYYVYFKRFFSGFVRGMEKPSIFQSADVQSAVRCSQLQTDTPVAFKTDLLLFSMKYFRGSCNICTIPHEFIICKYSVLILPVLKVSINFKEWKT